MRYKWGMSPYGAYINEKLNVKPTHTGILSSLKFAVKDVIAIQGHRNSAGNPDWLYSHSVSNQHAAVIEDLLRAGAHLYGVTHTDELMYSLNGENAHYGTPINPVAPKRIPGGSSSGSAVAAAAGLVDFAIGTDTGGSVRVPSSYCGLYGFRPTHGTVKMDGVIPLAPEFDTVGWMSLDPTVLRDVGRILQQDMESEAIQFKRICYGIDAWRLADQKTNDLLAIELVSMNKKGMQVEEICIAKEGLSNWQRAFRILQGRQIWQTHGEWIEHEQPVFGSGIGARFEWASTLTSIEEQEQRMIQKSAKDQLIRLLQQDTLLVIPTVNGPAPLLNSSSASLEERRNRTLQLTCIAGLAGLPQVTIPIGKVDGAPIGLSFIGGTHTDRALLSWVCDWVKEEGEGSK